MSRRRMHPDASPHQTSYGQFTKCGSGGTGRHTILRGWRRKAWGFKSPLPHHQISCFAYCFAIKKASNSSFGSIGVLCMWVTVLITIVHVIVCFFLIAVVLLQSGKSGDLAAAFGGQGSQTAFGPRGAASVLSRATTWSAVIFMMTSIILSIYAARRTGSTSVLSGVKPAQTKSQPATPTTPSAPPPTQK